MTLLALELSSDRRSVAVRSAGGDITEVVHQGTRGTPLFAMIQEALDRAGVARGDVGALAVGLGPGSYTGIRLALSVAQGWQLAAGIPVIGVGSLEVMAAVAPEDVELLLAVDSQRDEFAVVEALGRRLCGVLRLMPRRMLEQAMAEGGRVAGPDLPPAWSGARGIYPTAAALAQLAHGRPGGAAEQLTPVYLRETAFVKAGGLARAPGGD
ncbi:MAG: tRNA (adenosine(37)-N6)-threonylcarbamoyltransferase complex dimerization subunit type 1 TsaB [Verrucomicrobia bacterium]|nr:tRNA (adenosine(37)-N6)-threonylcarbamoyltransferase complex dimerization subunit type 1 TsaB [Verrucomicrobiota bacterium]